MCMSFDTMLRKTKSWENEIFSEITFHTIWARTWNYVMHIYVSFCSTTITFFLKRLSDTKFLKNLVLWMQLCLRLDQRMKFRIKLLNTRWIPPFHSEFTWKLIYKEHPKQILENSDYHKIRCKYNNIQGISEPMFITSETWCGRHN